MANQEHVDLIKYGVEAWNAWREANPFVTPDLDGVHLHGAHLRGAHLHKTILRNAVLHHADLRWADLDGAVLRRADLHVNRRA